MRKTPFHLSSRSATHCGSGHVCTNSLLPVRPMKSPELINTIVRAYELTRSFDPIDLGGSSNLNLHFPGPDGGQVARIYRAWVTPERLEGIQSVRASLRAAGLPFTQIRPLA